MELHHLTHIKSCAYSLTTLKLHSSPPHPLHVWPNKRVPLDYGYLVFGNVPFMAHVKSMFVKMAVSFVTEPSQRAGIWLSLTFDYQYRVDVWRPGQNAGSGSEAKLVPRR